eukprot:Hpha_TRINITY_DN14971_c5_g2::TRINITY_DN14971_c5_g2_i1::g.143949::m.143949
MSEHNSVAGSQAASASAAAAPPPDAAPPPVAELPRQSSNLSRSGSALVRKASAGSASGVIPQPSQAIHAAPAAPAPAGDTASQRSGQLSQAAAVARQESRASVAAGHRRGSGPADLPPAPVRQSSHSSMRNAALEGTQRDAQPEPSQPGALSQGSRKGSAASLRESGDVRATMRSSAAAMEAVAAAVAEELAEGGDEYGHPAERVKSHTTIGMEHEEAVARSDSRRSFHVQEPQHDPAPAASFVQPQYDHNDPVALNARVAELEKQLHDKDAELRHERSESEKLNARVESLNRLLSSNTQDSKVKILNEDLQKRAATIKKLEEENKRLSKKAESAGAGTADRRKSRAGSTATSPADVADRDAKIKELQNELEQTRSDLTRKRKEVEQGRKALEAAREKAAAAGVDVGEMVQRVPSRIQSMAVSSSDVENIKLRQMLAEREAEKQQIQCRLDRAQEAILSSAGTGFENEVKLQQARTALQCILKAHRKSPDQRDARTQSASAVPRDPSPAFVNPASGASAAFRSRTDVSSGVFSYPYSSGVGPAPILPPPPPGPAAYRSGAALYSPQRDRFAPRRVQ